MQISIKDAESLLAHDHEDLNLILEELNKVFSLKDLDKALEVLDSFWGRLAVHIRAENVFLFPALLNVLNDTEKVSHPELSDMKRKEISHMLAELIEDHNYFMKQLIPVVKKLRTLCKNRDSTGLSEIQNSLIPVFERLEKHNEIEETQIYRQAKLLLKPAEQIELNQKIDQDLKNLPARLQR